MPSVLFPSKCRWDPWIKALGSSMGFPGSCYSPRLQVLVTFAPMQLWPLGLEPDSLNSSLSYSPKSGGRGGGEGAWFLGSNQTSHHHVQHSTSDFGQEKENGGIKLSMLPWGGPAHLSGKHNQLFLHHLSGHPHSQIKLWAHPHYSEEELARKVQNHKESQTNSISLWKTFYFFFSCSWLFWLYWMLKLMPSLDKDWEKVIPNETWPQTSLKRDNVH